MVGAVVMRKSLLERASEVTISECHLDERKFHLFVANDLSSKLNCSFYTYAGFSGMVCAKSIILGYKKRSGRFSWKELDIFIPSLGIALELKKGKRKKRYTHEEQRLGYEHFFGVPVMLVYSEDYKTFQIDFDSFYENQDMKTLRSKY